MADSKIKTRDAVKGTIKTTDKAATATERMKSAYAKTKDKAEHGLYSDENSVAEYAADKVSHTTERVTEEGIHQFNKQGQKSVRNTKENIVKAKDKAADFKAKRAMQAAEKKKAQAAKTTAKATAHAVKAAVKATVSAIKAIIAGTKALISAIIAGGWIAVLMILIVVLFGALFSLVGNSGSNSSYTPVSAEVQAYEPLIQKYAAQHGIPEYVELIKAVMMQESGGKGSDPMQASECGFNKKYPNTPNGITDPEYSVNVGIQNLAACLKAAG